MGASLLVLVVFNQDGFTWWHRLGVFVFFAGNVFVVGRALARNVLKGIILAAAVLFFFAGGIFDPNWTGNWILWVEWASLLVIATHFVLVVWVPDETYRAPLPRQKRAEMDAR